jgi:hypothetical protein
VAHPLGRSGDAARRSVADAGGRGQSLGRALSLHGRHQAHARFDPDKGEVTVEPGAAAAGAEAQGTSTGIRYAGGGYSFGGKGDMMTFTAPKRRRSPAPSSANCRSQHGEVALLTSAPESSVSAVSAAPGLASVLALPKPIVVTAVKITPPAQNKRRPAAAEDLAGIAREHERLSHIGMNAALRKLVKLEHSMTRYTTRITAGPDDIDELGHVNNAVWVKWIQDVAVAHWHGDRRGRASCRLYLGRDPARDRLSRQRLRRRDGDRRDLGFRSRRAGRGSTGTCGSLGRRERCGSKPRRPGRCSIAPPAG